MKNLNITLSRKHFVDTKTDMDAYQIAIENAFEGYSLKFEIDASDTDAYWEESGGVTIIGGDISEEESIEVRQKLISIYKTLKSVD